MLHESELAAKVAAVNSANAHAMQLYPILVDFFRPYVGQKIFKADGSLLKKIQTSMPPFPDTDKEKRDLFAYRYIQGCQQFWLAWSIKACESFRGRNPGDAIATYYATTIYIGDVENAVFKEIRNPPSLRTDYTVEYVKDAIAKIELAEQALRDAESELHPCFR